MTSGEAGSFSAQTILWGKTPQVLKGRVTGWGLTLILRRMARRPCGKPFAGGEADPGSHRILLAQWILLAPGIAVLQWVPSADREADHASGPFTLWARPHARRSLWIKALWWNCRCLCLFWLCLFRL